MTKYDTWIKQNIKNVYGKCKNATKYMQIIFPELQRVRGYYYCTLWGRREHWWLITPLGVIVDPTAKQFPSKGKGFYIPWNEGDPEPTGKCIGCGGYTYNHETFCGKSCEQLVCLDLKVT